MFVIGTAGHVDHGKSTLVKALTGIDPDRLQEEKDRGMTIDLGFAWLKLPGGQEISIVDVPGHERFIKNMLAGVGGIDLAVLVVAADEGVMPQTSEHLAILDLLQVRRGVVAITKRDLVDDDWLELVLADVADTLAGTTLAGVPLVPVSAVTGNGLSDLITAIDRALATTPPRSDIGRPRLPIDRVFTVAGFGTVVTGTLIDGRLGLGQEVEIQPRGIRSKVRGLQTHRHKVDQALPGTRTAVNLQGLATTDLARGDVVTTPGWLKPTTAVDCRLRLVRDLPHPIKHNLAVTFHTGAAEVPARLRLLDRDEAAASEVVWAQLRLDEPAAVARGDFFIVRSTERTLGGGQIVDTHARRHRRLHTPTLDRLDRLARGTPADAVFQALDRGEPMDAKAIADRSGLPPDQVRAAAAELAGEGRAIILGDLSSGQGFTVSAAGWARVADRAGQLLRAFHQQAPLRLGMPKEEMKSRLKLQPRAFAETLARLAAEGRLVEDGTTVRLPDHQVRFSPQQQQRVDAYLRALHENPYSPPSESAPEPELVGALADRGEVVRVADNVAFAADAYREMVDRIAAHIRRHGKITVAEVRDLFGTSRKYVLALMEHLDEQRITRRIGDERVLRE